MSAKDVLKKAREAITNKDYATSIKLCKSILKDDKENYMALLFFGISLQETGVVDQAPKAFRKAIQINPSNPLAWNGLANYYQKLDDDKHNDELTEVYTTLLEIESNDQKLIDVLEKLSTIPILEEKLQIVVDKLMSVAKDVNRSKNVVNTAWASIASILPKVSDISSSLLDCYEEALHFIINQSQLKTRSYYLEYLKLLYKRNKYKLLFQQAEAMNEFYQDDKNALEWLCKIYNELTIEESDLFVNEKTKIQKYCDTLMLLEPESSMGMFTKSTVLFQQQNYNEAMLLLKQVTNVRPGLLHAWVLLSCVHLKLYFYQDAACAAFRADKLLQSINNSNTKIRKKLDILIAESSSRSSQVDTLNNGIEVIAKLVQDNVSSARFSICLLRSYINLKDLKKAHKTLLNLNPSEGDMDLKLLKAQIYRNEGELQKALDLLEGEKDVSLIEWWLEVGTLYWNRQEFVKSLTPFLKAAKLDQNCYLAFLHLGHYYQKFNDFDKARRCYEKVFALHPKFTEVAIELSKIYRLQQKWDNNIGLLQSITGGVFNDENQWAWIQLGLNYLEQEDYDRAIDTLRFIVRKNDSNSHCWESLADAYLARGAYTSALRSYQKVVEIKPNSLYPLLQIAHIKQSLGQFVEARTDYENILSSNKSYVPALKGIAETCLQQASSYRKEQLNGLARDCTQNAVDNISIGIQKHNTLSCLWKLAGDCCFIVASFPERFCCLRILTALARGENGPGNTILEGEELYVFAERCYCKALTLSQGNVLLYHDLAACYLSHAQFCADKTQGEELFKRALSIIKHCVTVNPTNWQHWNLMGVIAVKKEVKNYALAQHSFIKAVTIENNSAVAWCNMGTLYLSLENYKLANEAFSQAQGADPNYVNSWIGQALIAEDLGIEDSMDLFRHSTQLGMHQQGAIGYGHWVCRTLLGTPGHALLYTINQMHAIPIACDALTWYTENNPDDPCAWNMLGLLKERMGLNSEAAQAFKNAFGLCDEKYRDKIKLNYGRLLFKLRKYEDAASIFKTVKAATFSSGSWLALSLFKGKQYEESYETYEQALNWLTSEQTSQSDLLVALASMAYMFQGPDTAKTLLFQSTQLDPPSPYGLYATLSLGLLHEDLDLAKLVLNELKSIRDKRHCLQHYGALLVYTYLAEGQHETAVRELSKLIHRYPDEASLWLSLSILLLRFHKEFSSSISAASKCAQRSITLGRTNMDISKVQCIISLAEFLRGDYEQSFQLAQKAVHSYPDTAENWSILIAAGRQISKITDLWLKNVINHVQGNLNSCTLLDEWLTNQSMIEVK